MANTDELLQIYAIERQDHQTQGTIQLAIVGAGLAYAALAASKLADVCVGEVCRSDAFRPDVLLLLAVPLPLVALCGYFILSASSSLQRAAYLRALEEALQDAIEQPDVVRAPAGFRRSEVVWDPNPKRPPHIMRIVNALVYASILAIEGGLSAWALALAGQRSGRLLLLLAIGLYALWLVCQVTAAWVGVSDRLLAHADRIGAADTLPPTNARRRSRRHGTARIRTAPSTTPELLTTALAAAAATLFAVRRSGPLPWIALALGVATLLAAAWWMRTLRGRPSTASRGAPDEPGAADAAEGDVLREIPLVAIPAFVAAIVAGLASERAKSDPLVATLVVIVAAIATGLLVGLAKRHRWRRRSLAMIAWCLAALHLRSAPRPGATDAVAGNAIAGAVSVGSISTAAVVVLLALQPFHGRSEPRVTLAGSWDTGVFAVERSRNFVHPHEPYLAPDRWRLRTTACAPAGCSYRVVSPGLRAFIVRPDGHGSWRGAFDDTSDCILRHRTLVAKGYRTVVRIGLTPRPSTARRPMHAMLVADVRGTATRAARSRCDDHSRMVMRAQARRVR